MAAVLTDRELLERAAKAAGYVVTWHDNWQCFAHVDPSNTDNPPTLAGQRHVWTPLDDDGDAARLEAALWLSVQWRSAYVVVGSCSEAFDCLAGDSDRQAARRRAGVRAAAAIGRAMP